MADSPLVWTGGKRTLGPWIISKMPYHKKYVEVFFGAGHIFLQKPPAEINVVNDLNGALVSMWKTIRNEQKLRDLEMLFEYCVYSRELWEYFVSLYKDLKLWTNYSDFERAFMFIYINRCSFNGQMNGYSRTDSPRNLYEARGTLKAIFNHFQKAKVVFENLSFLDLLTRGEQDVPIYDDDDTFIYADPPYAVTLEAVGKKYYECLMSEFEHERLSRILFSHRRAKWMLSYDDHPLVRKWYSLEETKPGIFKSTKRENVEAILTPSTFQSAMAGKSEEALYRQELLISNYPLENANTLFS